MLKCDNFDLDGDDTENSSFLIEMEVKIKIKADGEEISIEGFIRFHNNLINIAEKAQYIRKQSRPIDTSKPTVRTINSNDASIKQTTYKQKRSNYGNQPNNGNGFKGKSSNDYQGNQNVARSSGNEGPSTPRYCIFCETNVHDTGFCKIA